MFQRAVLRNEEERGACDINILVMGPNGSGKTSFQEYNFSYVELLKPVSREIIPNRIV